jgi:hypothetical protein
MSTLELPLLADKTRVRNRIRIRIRIQIRAKIVWIRNRIQEAKKPTDPTDPDPEHWF